MNVQKDLASRYGMSWRGFQTWGTVDGFWFEVELPPNSAQSLKIRTAAQFPDEAAAHDADTAFASAMRDDKAIRYERTGAAITLHRRMPYSYRSLKTADVENMLQKAATILRGAGASPTCYHCGQNNAEGFVMVEGMALKYCGKCLSEAENSLEQRKEEYKSVENNYPRGILGAVLGALVGSIAWVVIGMLGYVAGIGGLAISFCAIKGYTMMKGKITKLAVVLICLISIAVMVLAQFLTYDIAVYNAYAKAGSPIPFGTVLQHTFEIPFMNSDIQAEFTKNTLIGLVFLALGAFSIIRQFSAKASAPVGKFERL